MSKVLVNESNLMAIGAAIRARNGTATTYRPGEMAAAIQAVPNRYDASDEGKVVSSGALVAQTSATKTANGTYDTTTNNEVVVNVVPNLQSKTVTENGTVLPDAGYDGLSSVIVNVSGGGGLTPTQISVIDDGAGSFISSNSILVKGGTEYTSYKALAIKLSDYVGCIINIDNTNGSRNYYGLFQSNSQGAEEAVFGGRQQASNGVLTFYADDYVNLAEYLVYDYTSTSGAMPAVAAYAVTI